MLFGLFFWQCFIVTQHTEFVTSDSSSAFNKTDFCCILLGILHQPINFHWDEWQGEQIILTSMLQHKSNSYVVLLEPLFMRRLHNWLVVSILCPSRTIYGKFSCLKFTMSPDSKNGWFPAGWYLTWQTHSLHVKEIRVTWFWVSVYLSGESRLWLKVKSPER